MKPAESPELITKFINFPSTWQCFRTIHTVDFIVCSSQCSRRPLTQTSRYRVIYHRRWFIPEDLLAPIMAGQIIFRTPDRQHGSLHSCVLMYTEVVSLSFSNWVSVTESVLMYHRNVNRPSGSWISAISEFIWCPRALCVQLAGTRQEASSENFWPKFQ